MSRVHEPVLCEEAIRLLNCRPGGIYVDGTLGGGGHASRLFLRCPDVHLLIGIDRDAEALMRAQENLSPFKSRCVFAHGTFADIEHIIAARGITRVDGILLDLGISRYQLAEPERGFSFSLDGDLDMRMDRKQKETAAELVNTLNREGLERILREYGEEKWASAIANKIVQQRSRRPIKTTRELAELVSGAVPRRAHPRTIHPATRTFMAFRIAVNDELNHLRQGLEKGITVLAPSGRFAVIAFHSLEDRMVKNTFRAHARQCVCPPRIPQCRCGHQAVLKVLTARPIVPSPEEVTRNPLSRSARLRGAEKLLS